MLHAKRTGCTSPTETILLVRIPQSEGLVLITLIKKESRCGLISKVLVVWDASGASALAVSMRKDLWLPGGDYEKRVLHSLAT
eukprot:15342358-Ditylum_brightwellii.AAC.1